MCMILVPHKDCRLLNNNIEGEVEEHVAKEHQVAKIRLMNLKKQTTCNGNLTITIHPHGPFSK